MKKIIQISFFICGALVVGFMFIKFIFPVKEKNFKHEMEKEARTLSYSDKLRAEGHNLLKNLKEVSISDVSPLSNEIEIKEGDNSKKHLSRAPAPFDNWTMTNLIREGKLSNNQEADNRLFENVITNQSDFKNTAQSTLKIENTQGKNQKIYDDTPLQETLKSKFARQAKLSGTVTTLSGLAQSTERASMFKAGSRVLALLPDKLTVTSGESIFTSLVAFGSTDQKIPNNLTFVGKAKLNKPERRVEIIIESCVNTKDNSPPIPCHAIIKDILGDNGLTGKIYDPSNWQLITSAIGAFLNTYILSQLTTSATQNGVAVDQTTANHVKQAMVGTVNSVTNQLNSNMDRSGKEIKIAQGAMVQVFFTDSTPTWNDEK